MKRHKTKATKDIGHQNSYTINDLASVEHFLRSNEAFAAVIEPIYWSKDVMYVLPHHLTNGKTTLSLLESWPEGLNYHFLCSFALKEGANKTSQSPFTSLQALVDNQDDIFTVIDLLNNNNIRLIGYDLKPLLITIKRLESLRLDQNPPSTRFKKTWDILVADRAINLGKWDKRYSRLSEFTTLSRDTGFNLPEAHDFIEENPPWEFDINAVAMRYDALAYRSRDELYQTYSALSGNSKKSTSKNDSIYSYFLKQHDAFISIYLKQNVLAKSYGITRHLKKTEFKWTEVLANIDHNGFTVDIDKIRKYSKSISEAKRNITKSFARLSKEKPSSSVECTRTIVDILQLRSDSTDISFDKLMNYTDSNYLDKKEKKTLTLVAKHRELLIASDNLTKISNYNSSYNDRIHPTFVQLGQLTGRDNVENTNSPIISRSLRNIVVPCSGYGIIEADYSQFEPNIAACVHNDSNLIHAINKYKDVYAYVAYLLAHCDQQQPSVAKPKLKDVISITKTNAKLRTVAKECLVGMFNGMTLNGLENILNDAALAQTAYNLNPAFPGL